MNIINYSSRMSTNWRRFRRQVFAANPLPWRLSSRDERGMNRQRVVDHPHTNSSGYRTAIVARSLSVFSIAAIALLLSAVVLAQDDTDKKVANTPVDSQRRTEDVSASDRLSFNQSQVAAEMSELEQRMFRLAESIKKLEPENSSRLMLGLKYARQELILHQMKETVEALGALDLATASGEQKQLLAKLARLQELLLSDDLDFQMRLERLRQIREVLKKLDVAIKEEERQRDRTSDVAEKKEKAEGLKKRLATLSQLIARQKQHIEAGQDLVAKAPSTTPSDEALSTLHTEQSTTQTDTAALASEQATAAGSPSKNLDGASQEMQSAAKSLEEKKTEQSLPPMQKALELLKKEQERLAQEKKKLDGQINDEQFASMKKEQTTNRQFSDGITDTISNLGDSGKGALGEMLRAGRSMQGAEGQLGQGMPDPASRDQSDAVKSLKYARDQLAQEAERLLQELRSEVKQRVLEGLTLMLEKQKLVRQETESLAPRVAKGSRQALTAVSKLSKREGDIVLTATTLITLVEETEFGIALPAALWVVRDAMEDVEASLEAGDASSQVVDAEKRIEEDLKSLLEAMKQLPSPVSSGKPRKGSPQERLRELNRLVAELKMIRILQQRINTTTAKVDRDRAEQVENLSTQLRRRIDDLRGSQEDVLDVTDRLAAERGDEVPSQ